MRRVNIRNIYLHTNTEEMEFISPESSSGRDQRFGHDDRVEIPPVYT